MKIAPTLLVLIASFCALASLAASLPKDSQAADFSPFFGQVTEDDVNIRADSTVGSPVIVSLKKDAPLEAVEEMYDWYKVRLPRQAPSFIRKDLLECVDSKSEELPLGSKDFPGAKAGGVCLNARVSATRVNIRLQPDENAPVLGKADQGVPVAIASETKEWYKIVPTPDTFGWIHKKFVKKSEPPPPAVEKGAKAPKERKKKN